MVPKDSIHEADQRVAVALRLLANTRNGRRSDGLLRLGPLLTELDAWLADDKQWRSGHAQHWQTLLDDIRSELAGVVAISPSDVQNVLNERRDQLRKMRGDFSRHAGEPDQSLRRQLERISHDICGAITDAHMLDAGWQRVLGWGQTDGRRAERGLAAVRDLAELQGHDPDALFETARLILADDARAIHLVSGHTPPADFEVRAERSAEERLELVRTTFYRNPQQASGIVWLVYVNATIGYPWILELGPHITLFQSDLLVSMLHDASDDPRMPDDLRTSSSPHTDTSWFGEPATVPAGETPIDGRVFLRLELPAGPRRQLLREAREIAEFLSAFGGLIADNHDLWQLGDSHLVRGWEVSSSYDPINADLLRRRSASDGTALHLARNATGLGAHIPYPDNRLRVAARLLVWLRQATGSHTPAQVVLCDRVVEQVAGWAGISKPDRFVRDHLRHLWIHSRVSADIVNAYLAVHDSPSIPEALRSEIESDQERPAYSPRSYRPSINLKLVLENVEPLISSTPDGRTAGLIRLRARLASRESVEEWLDDLGAEFDRRNAALRRNRNALMHGGPIVQVAVDNVSDFALSLAFHALTPAIELMLGDKDLVDGFLDHQRRLAGAEAMLRRGVAPTEALFPN